jgi:hypothetical protein
MTKLELLYAQKSKKFEQLCAVAARELGYGELSTLSVEGRMRVDDQVEQYVEQWEETVEMRTSLTLRPITPLRRLLAEYQDICERILDEHEIDAGLWAYRKGSSQSRAPRKGHPIPWRSSGKEQKRPRRPGPEVWRRSRPYAGQRDCISWRWHRPSPESWCQ